MVCMSLGLDDKFWICSLAHSQSNKIFRRITFRGLHLHHHSPGSAPGDTEQPTDQARVTGLAAGCSSSAFDIICQSQCKPGDSSILPLQTKVRFLTWRPETWKSERQEKNTTSAGCFGRESFCLSYWTIRAFLSSPRLRVLVNTN